MRFIHMADMHFDTPCTTLDNKRDLGDIRRLEQREIFKNIIEYIKQNNILFLFISGDLYEHEYIRQTTIEYINNLFKQIPETKIFITPGNHDPFLKNSYYANFNWNNNVYIFDAKIKKYEFEEFDIYGYGFDDFYCRESSIENIKIENKNKINILITHGTINASHTLEMQYNPLNQNKLKELGFDYIALGHIHKRQIIDSNIVYPGSTISFGFDELGEHGILDIILEKNNNLKNKIINENKLEKNNLIINFIKLDNRIFEEKNINISDIFTEEELIEKINNENFEENKMYKIILEGKRKIEINTNKIYKLLLQDNVIKLKDNTDLDYDLQAISKKDTLKGFFVREMLDKLEDENLSKEEVEKAIELGLNALK